jgi:predicted TIM-barrel fold metal-dependent hydrolase
LTSEAVTNSDCFVDCHVHVIDPERFPISGTRGYKPQADEYGTRETLGAVLDRHGITHAVLVQMSGYGSDNAAILDAIKTYPKRFKAIVQIDPSASDKTLEYLASAGAVGVRFNLVKYDPGALLRHDAPRLLQRLKTLGWFAQIYADDAQWQSAAPILKASGVHALVDHFGVCDITRGTDQKGFQAILAMGREGNATIKFSSLFRVSHLLPGFNDLDPFVEELLAAFGVDGCIWGSDWPFINVPRRPHYVDVLAPLARWLPDPADRECVVARTPRRLFAIGG